MHINKAVNFNWRLNQRQLHTDENQHLRKGWALREALLVNCYGLNACVLPNFYVEALIHSMTMFGDVEGIGWNEVRRVSLIWLDRCPYKMQRHQSSLSTMWGPSKKVPSLNQKRILSTYWIPSTLISNFQSPELWEINFWVLDPSVFGTLFNSPSLLYANQGEQPPVRNHSLKMNHKMEKSKSTWHVTLVLAGDCQQWHLHSVFK